MTAELHADHAAEADRLQQIRDFISGEFEPVPLADVVAYFQAQEKAGLVKLIEKAPEPVKARKKNEN